MKGFYTNFIKVIIDFIIALILLVLISPLLIVITVLIKLESPGPALFKQIRVGRNLKEFTIFKFRSMFLNDDKSFTSANDPRITKIGNFIRKTSLDEIPQILNILLGQMSFVGPRPCQPFEINQYSEDDYILRHSVRPGITGLHQVTFRSSGTVEDKANCDIQYVKNISLINDLNLILKTFKILNGKTSN